MQLDSLRLGVAALICAVPLAAGLVGLYRVVQTGDDLIRAYDRADLGAEGPIQSRWAH